jgi:hypothetical protein
MMAPVIILGALMFVLWDTSESANWGAFGLARGGGPAAWPFFT